VNLCSIKLPPAFLSRGIFERLLESSLGEPNEEKFEPDLALCFMVKIIKKQGEDHDSTKEKDEQVVSRIGDSPYRSAL
jgi:hypothetical protein